MTEVTNVETDRVLEEARRRYIDAVRAANTQNVDPYADSISMRVAWNALVTVVRDRPVRDAEVEAAEIAITRLIGTATIGELARAALAAAREARDA